MRARVLIACGNESVVGQVRSMSIETQSMSVVAAAGDSAETVDLLRRTDVDVILLDADLGPLSVIELARSIGVSFPFVGIVMMSASSSPATLRAAVDCGARGVLTLPLSFEELDAAVTAAAEWAQGVRQYAANPRLTSMPTRGATIVAVAGGKGGAGTSTVALHLALTIAQYAQKRKRRRLVCLADFSETGDARLRLDIYARRDILDLAQVSRELSVRHLEEALYVHHTGLRVLLGPEQAEFRDEVDAGATRAIIGALAASHEVVVLDLGVGISRSALAAAELADEALIVTTPDVVSIRAANRLAALWERASTQSAEVRLLLNRASRRSEIQPELLGRAAQVGVSETHIPANFRGLEASLNSGAPETMDDNGLTRAFVSLADELDVLEDPAEEDEVAASGAESKWWRRTSAATGTTELDAIGIAVLAVVMGVAVLQILLVGVTFVLAENSAQRGARASAVGEPPRPPVNAGLPAPWRDKKGDVTLDTPSPGVATVTLRVPRLIPGLSDSFSITSTGESSSERDNDLAKR